MVLEPTSPLRLLSLVAVGQLEASWEPGTWREDSNLDQQGEEVDHHLDPFVMGHLGE